MLKNKNLLIKLVVLIFTVSCMVFSFACSEPSQGAGNSGLSGGKKIPVYEGMTISKTQSYSVAPVFAKGSENGNEDNNGNHNGWYKGDHDKDSSIDKNNPYPDNNKNENIKNEIESSLTVVGADKDIYYASQNEDIYINIHINNPDNFEILSFTINGKKYSSYMFEYGSTMELIIIKYNVGNVSGIIDYTIDAIKYVDGTEIKDVILGGEKTIRAGVRKANQVTAVVSNVVINTNDISFNANVKDDDGLISFSEGAVKAVLYNGEEIVEVKELEVGENSVTFNNLNTNSVYQYAIVGYYDALLNGFAMNTLYVDAFKTEAVVLFNNISIGYTGIEFGFAWNSKVENKQLTSLALYKNDEKIQDLLVGTEKVENLLSDNEYKLVAEYLNGEKQESIYLEFATVANQKPILSILATEILQTSVTFDVNVKDVDNVCEITKIIFISSTGEEILAEDISIRRFNDLDLITGGKIKVEYVYDLNNGLGIIEESVELNVCFGSQGLNYKLINNNSYEVTGIGTCTDNEVVIPLFYNNLPVIRIAYNAFKNVKSFNSMVISNSVTAIGSSAFYNCSGLNSVVLGNSLNSIGGYAFYGCYAITSISIPESLSSIGDGVFSGCSNLTDVYITNLEKWCLISFGMYESNPFYYAKNLYLNNELVTELVIPKSITSLNKSVFSGCDSLINVLIHKNVTFIGEWGLNGCENLKTVKFEEDSQLTVIDAYAFANSPSLLFINIPKNVMSIADNAFWRANIVSIYCEVENKPAGWSDNWNSSNRPVFWNFKEFGTSEEYEYYLTNDNKAYITAYKGSGGDVVIPESFGEAQVVDFGTVFKENTAITSVVMPNSVTSISRDAFSGCSSLVSVVIPNSVTSIGDYAFSGCTSLTSIAIPNSVTSIGNRAFYNCKALTIYCEVESKPAEWSDNWNSSNRPVFWNFKEFGTSEEYDYCLTNDNKAYITAYKGNGGDVVIPKTLGEAQVVDFGTVFKGNSAITSIVMPDTVTSIADSAFSGCGRLTSIEISDSITSIPSSLFNNCSSLTSVVIPNSVTSIGSNAFYYCSSLTSIEIPNSVTSIGSNAFYYCSGLSEVNYLGCIDDWAEIEFEGFNASPIRYARQLKIKGEVVTEVNVTTATKISAYAFYNCSSLTSVVISNSVAFIGERAFFGCGGLTSVEISDSVVTIDSNAFDSCASLTICCEAESEPLSWDVNWNSSNCPVVWNFKEFGSTDDYDYIATNDNKAYITAYKGSGGDVVIPESFGEAQVVDFGAVFKGNKAITSVVIPNSVTSIGSYAFYDCDGLTSIAIPNAVISIGDLAFSGCDRLSSIGMSNSVTSIGMFAFRYCGSLTSVVLPNSITSIGKYAFGNCTSLTSIKYCGTEEEWNTVLKDDNWDYSTDNYTITYNWDGE